jgi:alpha-mannosidase
MTLHMIGGAHIDPVWLWQWQEGFYEVRATFRSALDRMQEYDDFVFAASSSAFYEWIELTDPTMFAEIQQRVIEGRWELVGGWWIEPDCNIPSGESFVRQGLLGQHYLKTKFNRTARVGFNIDSFGHASTLPQILQKSGIPYYTFLRPMPDEAELPSSLFWWESDDGSRVLAYRIPFDYASWGEALDDHVRRCAAELDGPSDEGMCFYGVGNHGGGPTKENLDSIRRIRSDPDRPQVVFSSPERFFDSVASKGSTLPVVHAGLQRHAPGCYAAHSAVKRWNRSAENRLIAAEKWSALASWAHGHPYPVDLGRAWRNVLFNQFHDILAGTSLEVAYDDARDTYGEALAIADRALTSAIHSVASKVRIDQVEGVRPMIVFNALTWPVRATVDLETRRWPAEAVLLDDQDQPIRFQQSPSATVTSRVRLRFTTDLPALGYRVYRLMPAGPSHSFTMVNATDTVLENEALRLEIDPETGHVTRLLDRRTGTEVFAARSAIPVVIDDQSDTWGHGVTAFDDVVGAFCATSVRLVEAGPVQSVIRVTSRYGASSLTQDFTMRPDGDQIDVRAQLDWREQRTVLKLRFPVSVDNGRVTNEVAYGHVHTAATGDEMPMQSWVDGTGTSRDTEVPYGLGVVNDSKYSFDVKGCDIGMTIVRSPAYAHHDPTPIDPAHGPSYIDQGIQRFAYSLVPHAGGWAEAGIVKRAAELNQQPVAMFVSTNPDGPLDQTNSFIDVQPSNILVTVLKQAEDGSDLILRAFETTKSATDATIVLPTLGRIIESSFAPCEIKTFRIPRDPTRSLEETDLIEGSIDDHAP